MPRTIHQGEIVSAPNNPLPGNTNLPQDDNTPVEPSLSLRDFFEVLKRRKIIALSVFLVVVALGVLVTLFTKPVYSTGAKLLVEGRSNQLSLGNNNDSLSDVFQPKSGRDVDTQIEILRSPLVLDRVYKAADITPGAVDLTVRRVQQTDVIEVSVTSHSREDAEKFATTLPQIYEKDTRSDKLRAVTASLDFAQKSLQEQNDKLQLTELELEKFKNRKGVVNTGSEATDAITVASANRSELAKAELDNARLQAQLAALGAERRVLSPTLNTPVTTTNPQIQQLKDQIASLGSDRARLLFLYKPTGDEVRKVDLQIADLKRRLASTPTTNTNSTRSLNPAIAAVDEKISDARTALNASQKSLLPLRQQVAQQVGTLGRFNNIQRVEARLQRDLENSTGAFKTLSDNVLQLSLRKTALEAAAAPVTTMEVDGRAVKIAPRPSRNLIASMFLGALLACGAALLRESLDDHIRDEEEARRLLGTNVLGYFPLLATNGVRPVLNQEKPDRNLLESFRVLRSNVQFALVNSPGQANSPGQKILVTSSVPGEGKSYVASNLAIAMALNGRHVVLIDADLHRPRQHEIFNSQRSPGLSELLVGNVTLQECVRDVGIPGLSLISAGVTPPNPAELLSSSKMDDLIDHLGKKVDLVIFDSPPLLATSDSQVISAKVDGVIYVMHLGKVPRSATQRSFELLQQARANIIGMVFNQIENKNSSSYGGYYHYSDYHKDDADKDAPRLLAADENGVNALLARAKRFVQDSSQSFERKGHSNNEGHSNNGSKNADSSANQPKDEPENASDLNKGNKPQV